MQRTEVESQSRNKRCKSINFLGFISLGGGEGQKQLQKTIQLLIDEVTLHSYTIDTVHCEYNQ